MCSSDIVTRLEYYPADYVKAFLMMIVLASESISHLSENRWFVITRHLALSVSVTVSGYSMKMLELGGSEFVGVNWIL